ncbi:Gp138 family membrane-puncturing spike protein [Pseudomonas sp. GXZC]|uniref:Gp138 family membrane-puncturing spike protein n=1 Tax=Pseudomonas sp. GXZC TaxID=3003351 RepID=UPI0022AB297B|nr:Gp138 family membrane-puncturing spike protein [Pseudomonas sp. GXZC]WAT31821.1 Gp138 family membrane-puncturing spike protein [Pseudomonas sp. GXZC]
MTLTTATTAPEERERIAFDRQSAHLRTATPGIVVAVHANGTVDVQPAIMQVTTLDGKRSDEALSVVSGVPTIFAYYAQTLGLSITLPIQAGDEGLLIVADRSIDNWQVAGGVQAAAEPVSPRHHNLTDGLFLPGAISEPKAISSVSADAIQIRNADGTTCVSVREREVVLQVGSAMLSVAEDTITLSAGGSTLTLGGAIELQSPALTHNGKHIGDTHAHGNVTPGQGQTGAPV